MNLHNNNVKKAFMVAWNDNSALHNPKDMTKYS